MMNQQTQPPHILCLETTGMACVVTRHHYRGAGQALAPKPVVYVIEGS